MMRASRFRRVRGVTLIELLIVVVVIGSSRPLPTRRIKSKCGERGARTARALY